jgi:hypothetical protein
MAEAGALDPTHETFREYDRVVDPKHLQQIRAEAKEFPLSISLARPHLRSVQYEALRAGKIRSGLAL